MTGVRAHVVETVHRRAANQCRVVRRSELLADSIKDSEIRALVDAHHMAAIFPGIYLVGYPRLDQSALAKSALALGGDNTELSHRTAAELRGCLRVRQGEVHAITRTESLVGEHRSELPMLDGSKATVVLHAVVGPHPPPDTFDGWPVTAVPRMLVHIAATEGPVVLSWAWDEAEYRSLLDPIAIERELASRRAPGNRHVRKLLLESFPAVLPDDEVRSRKELAIARLIAATPLPRPVLNAHVATDGGDYHPDVLYPGILAVEVDGPVHDLRRRNARDKVRDANLLANGLPVLHFTTERIETELAWCADRLVRTYMLWAARLKPAA